MRADARKILVVEDDPDILRIVSHTLRGAGYDVVHAYGGENALRKIEKDTFDLVVTDLAMPGVSGVQVIDALKNNPRTSHVPVIAVTAHRLEPITDSAAFVGCDAFVSKPFRSSELLREVERQLTARLQRGVHRVKS